MPGDAVVRTEEPIGNNVDKEGLKRMIELRLKAGAITCKVKGKVLVLSSVNPRMYV